MSTDANLTSDNQLTQSFDERLESALVMLFANLFDARGKAKDKTWADPHIANAMAAIKAAIREARPHRNVVRVGGNPKQVIAEMDGNNAALDEWTKNMDLEDK